MCSKQPKSGQRKQALLKGLPLTVGGWPCKVPQSAESIHKRHLRYKNFSREIEYKNLSGISIFSQLQTEPSTITTPTTQIDEYSLLKPSQIPFLLSFALSLVFTVQGLRAAICPGHPCKAANFKLGCLFDHTHPLGLLIFKLVSQGTFKAPLNDALEWYYLRVLHYNTAVWKIPIRTLDFRLQLVNGTGKDLEWVGKQISGKIIIDVSQIRE